MKQKSRVILLLVLSCALLLAGCGASGTNEGGTNSEYQKIRLVMAVNGTNTQIDSRVAYYFAELVEERSGGNVTVDVFPNDQLAGGSATKGIEMVAQGSVDIAATATPRPARSSTAPAANTTPSVWPPKGSPIWAPSTTASGRSPIPRPWWTIPRI